MELEKDPFYHTSEKERDNNKRNRCGSNLFNTATNSTYKIEILKKIIWKNNNSISIYIDKGDILFIL